MTTKLQNILSSFGRFPPVFLQRTPLSGGGPTKIERFISYSFSNSIVVPVSTFSFEYRLPDDSKVVSTDVAQEGDIVSLYANDKIFSTGLIDTIGHSVNARDGERGQIEGRNMLAQFEDNDAVTIGAEPIWGDDNSTINSVMQTLCASTRINPNFRTQDGPTTGNLFATEPGESKIQALLRYLEPLNCLVWQDPDGTPVIGKPNFSSASLGTWFVQKHTSPVGSNVLDMKVRRAAASIPNVVIPVWSGSEGLVNQKDIKQHALINAAQGPNRLYQNKHYVIRSSVVSSPTGNSVQALSDTNRLRAGDSAYLQSWAKRLIATANRQELEVTITIPGHYNQNGDPILIDQVYEVINDRAPVNELMYVYAVDYSLTEKEGQRTTMHLCKLNTIVADTKVQTSAPLAGAGGLGTGIA